MTILIRFIAAFALLASWNVPIFSSDLTKIDRTVAKEPAYKGKPKYCLLVFGPAAKERVWLVQDGDTLYVDRKGNGDLTDPKNKIEPEKRPGRDAEEDGYSFDVGDLTVGGREHKALSVYLIPLKLYADSPAWKRSDLKAVLAKDPHAMLARISMDVAAPGIKGGGTGGRVTYSAGPLDLAGIFQFAATPADAPVVHLGGPLQITFYGYRPILRVGRGSELTLVVGTPGVGPGTFAMVSYADTIPDSAKPFAEITFPPAKAGGAPTRERLEIKSRC